MIGSLSLSRSQQDSSTLDVFFSKQKEQTWTWMEGRKDEAGLN